ncbi:MAG: dependent epimerase/dehydratase family protein [Ilumatobacteraceae bacterium]|nr:dependent epimerase/dehydratase family protein [Ilumatobacteraceae bacterium]
MSSAVPSRELEGRRILVVGASSGIGRHLGLLAASHGATVAFAARRASLVQEAALEAGQHSIGLVLDVRDPASCEQAVAEVVDAFGGLDDIVYSTAVDRLVRLADADADVWRDTYETNVIGAALVCRAALPHLKASRGRAVFISASSVGRPLPGMSVYASSKAALEEMVRGWRGEHPDLAFATVRVGSALGTGVTDQWDRELLVELSSTWQQLGYVHDNGPGAPMTAEQAAEVVLLTLTSPVWLRELTVVSDPGRYTPPIRP